MTIRIATKRIAMWSGPRNLSTAMMRSFGARADTFVSDEPFYGAYLKTTRDPQPMIDEIIADMDCDWESVKEAQNGDAPDGSAVWYQKHMPHHMEGPVDITDFPGTCHAFLIRDPVRVAASYANKRTSIRPEHLGVTRQREYFEKVADQTGYAPPVIDSYDILLDPPSALEKLCEALDIAWDPAMLSWEKGPHKEDGIWSAHWYDKVNASTGFGKVPEAIAAAMPEVGEDYLKVAEECREDYEFLAQYAIKSKDHAG